MTKDIKVTTNLIYLLFAIDAIGYDATNEVLRRGGYGGPTTMLSFFLKLSKLTPRIVV